MGYGYNWEYDRVADRWSRAMNKKAIGTPCRSFLFDASLEETKWSSRENIPFPKNGDKRDISVALKPGLYELHIHDWKLEAEIADKPGYNDYRGDMGPYCADPSTFQWNIEDATHLI